MLTFGPTRDIVASLSVSLGQYAASIGPLSKWIGRENLEFMHGWTTFYWAWWISWSLFVGMFIARISRGRTVRGLIGCMLISVLWMNALGGSALLQYVRDGYPDVVATVQTQQPEISLFAMLGALPFAGVTSCIAMVLVVIFFVTSSDSGLGSRHDHGWRQTGCAGGPTGLLVHFRRHRRDCAAARRRTRHAGGRRAGDRLSLLACPSGNLLEHVAGSARQRGVRGAGPGS